MTFDINSLKAAKVIFPLRVTTFHQSAFIFYCPVYTLSIVIFRIIYCMPHRVSQLTYYYPNNKHY